VHDLLTAAAGVGASTGETALPPDILRFTLEYAAAPDIEAERRRLSTLLEGDRFDLFALSEDDPDLLILQFPGVARAQSPDFLFEAADALAEELDLVSATPEIDAPYTDVGSIDARTEALGGGISAFCRSGADPQANSRWAIEMIKADAARARFGVSGAGVRIGQPDTGVAEHDELDQGVDLATGFDFLAGKPEPIDPLKPSMRSPGHGTGVASVAISRETGAVTGAAPGATLVPVRCVNSVIIGDGAAVAKAIDHARAQSCRIVTLSLGGLFASPALKRAIARALRADMIVIASAGNCVRLVVQPARRPEVIAISGVNRDFKPWRGACRGEAVDASAPAENVHVARRHASATGAPPTAEERAKISDDAQGTSFSAALTAGVAALWLERFGFEACRDEARRRDVPLQELFRAALTATAHAPDGWEADKMGAGVVDAEALLALPLDQIPASTPQPEAPPPLLADAAPSLVARFAAEAEFLDFDRRLRTDPDGTAGLETPIAPAPSPGLARLLGPQPDEAEFPAPASIAAPATPPTALSDALRRLATPGGDGFEAGGALSEEDAVARIREEGADNLLASVERSLRDRRGGSDRVDNGVQDEAMARFERALANVTRTDRSATPEDGDARYAFEAMVRLTGRPALRITDNISDLRTDPNVGEWKDALYPNRARWLPTVRAVGRIDARDFRGRWAHAGTGFVLPGNRIMTNRHVLDVFADPLPASAGEQKFRIRRRASIIFDPDAKDEATRFEITGIVTAGKERIGRVVDLAKLDMAILTVEGGDAQRRLPNPVEPSDVTTAPDGDVENVMVIGYPARPSFRQAPSDASDAATFWDRVEELYGDEFGVKYISPGALMSRPGALAGDAIGWAFSHDATTFAGNSGSAIISLHGQMRLCGLHFGGSTLTRNYAHDIATVRRIGDGVFDTDAL